MWYNKLTATLSKFCACTHTTHLLTWCLCRWWRMPTHQGSNFSAFICSITPIIRILLMFWETPILPCCWQSPNRKSPYTFLLPQLSKKKKCSCLGLQLHIHLFLFCIYVKRRMTRKGKVGKIAILASLNFSGWYPLAIASCRAQSYICIGCN